MKKNYIKPEMKVYEIESQQLLAGSGTGVESGVSFTATNVPMTVMKTFGNIG